jgi:hypothetical protein
MASPATICSLAALSFLSLVRAGDIPALNAVRDLHLGVWSDWQKSTVPAKEAARHQQLTALLWLNEECFTFTDAAAGAVDGGSLPALWLVELVAPNTIGRHTLRQALASGRIPVIEWLVKKKGVELDFGLIMTVAERGDLATLQWCYRNAEEDFVDTYHGTILMSAAEGGHIPTVQWLLETGPVGKYKEMWSYAAGAGQVKLLEWGRGKYRFPSPRKMDHVAGTGGQRAVVEWSLTWRGVGWINVGQGAIEGNQPEMLSWAQERGYQPDETSMAIALAYESKEVFLQLLKEGCPYDRSNLYEIAHMGQDSERLLRWLDKYLA